MSEPAYGPPGAVCRVTAMLGNSREEETTDELAARIVAALYAPALGDDRSVCVRSVIAWWEAFYAGLRVGDRR